MWLVPGLWSGAQNFDHLSKNIMLGVLHPQRKQISLPAVVYPSYCLTQIKNNHIYKEQQSQAQTQMLRG